MANRVVLDTRGINNILRNLDDKTGKAVRTVGLAIVREAQILAPVDTGALRASIYMRTASKNDVPAVASDAERVELPSPHEKTTVTLGPSVDYGIWQELGTGVMAAQPYLLPAIERITHDLTAYHRGFREAMSGE